MPEDIPVVLRLERTQQLRRLLRLRLHTVTGGLVPLSSWCAARSGPPSATCTTEPAARDLCGGELAGTEELRVRHPR